MCRLRRSPAAARSLRRSTSVARPPSVTRRRSCLLYTAVPAGVNCCNVPGRYCRNLAGFVKNAVTTAGDVLLCTHIARPPSLVHLRSPAAAHVGRTQQYHNWNISCTSKNMYQGILVQVLVYFLCTYIARPPSIARRRSCWLHILVHSSSTRY